MKFKKLFILQNILQVLCVFNATLIGISISETIKEFNPLNPGQFTHRCTANPERSGITYQYQYRFFGSVNSGNYYISPTYHIYCSLSVPCIPTFLSQNLNF